MAETASAQPERVIEYVEARRQQTNACGAVQVYLRIVAKAQQRAR
jgi:hypothetical protein